MSVIAGSRLDLLDAMEALEADKPELAQALVLRDICQLDYAEVAEQLGIPLGTAKSRIHQARKYVQACSARPTAERHLSHRWRRRRRDRGMKRVTVLEVRHGLSRPVGWAAVVCCPVTGAIAA